MAGYIQSLLYAISNDFEGKLSPDFKTFGEKTGYFTGKGLRYFLPTRIAAALFDTAKDYAESHIRVNYVDANNQPLEPGHGLGRFDRNYQFTEHAPETKEMQKRIHNAFSVNCEDQTRHCRLSLATVFGEASTRLFGIAASVYVSVAAFNFVKDDAIPTIEKGATEMVQGVNAAVNNAMVPRR